MRGGVGRRGEKMRSEVMIWEKRDERTIKETK